MKILYDKPIEVSKEKYFQLVSLFSGRIAYREENNRYFVKLWIMGAKEEFLRALES
jgi:hypothetical protein